ncbi:MAG: DUF624 domain-containing protein [Candidatus Eisenbacteria bacterium]|nr:DUF624 domain-containing protein [Candidatus Eisenbacteria bacterium]
MLRRDAFHGTGQQKDVDLTPGHGNHGLQDPSGRDSTSPVPMRAAEILRPTFKRFLWHAYDHLGLLVAVNLLWLLMCAPVVTAPASTAALFRIGRKIASHEDVSIRDFFFGFRAHFLPAIKVGSFTLVVVFMLWVNVDFYSHLGGWATLPGMLLAAVMIWAGVFLALMHAHLHPLIADGDRALRVLLSKSALLTLDNVGYTVGVTVQAASVAAICVLTGAGLVLVLGSFTALLLSCGHRELLKRYFPESPEAGEPEETRGWRDFWKPWESRRKE